MASRFNAIYVPNSRLDEGPPPVRVSDHWAEPLGSLVPASDGQEGLQVAVVGLQSGELAVAAWRNDKRKMSL